MDWKENESIRSKILGICLILFILAIAFFTFSQLLVRDDTYVNIERSGQRIGNSIFYKYDNKIYALIPSGGYYIVEDADVDSFSVINSENTYDSRVVGIDKNHVYFGNVKIEDLNPKNISYIGNGYYTDGKSSYFCSPLSERNDELSYVSEIFGHIVHAFFKDKKPKSYIYPYHKLNTEKKISKINNLIYFATDGDVLYYKGKALENADANTMKQVSKHGEYFCDKNNVYYRNVPMKGIDPKTFEPFVNYTHVKDKNGIHHFYLFNDDLVVEKVELSPEIDLKTLQSFENYAEYSKDKNNVYYDFQKIEGADIKTFEPDGYSIGKDKTGVYYKTHKINGIDVNSTEVLENEFYKDKNNIYYRNKKLENFKPENFEVISSSLVGQNEDFYYFTEDENDNTKFILLENKNVDAETFEVLDEEYTKDKNNAYYKGKILKGVDVKTLDIYYNKSDNGYKIKDKNKVYKIVND